MNQRNNSNEDTRANKIKQEINSAPRNVIRTNNLRDLIKSRKKVAKETEIVNKNKLDVDKQETAISNSENILNKNIDKNIIIKDQRVNDLLDNSKDLNSKESDSSEKTKIKGNGRISSFNKLKQSFDLEDLKKYIKDFTSRNYNQINKNAINLSDDCINQIEKYKNNQSKRTIENLDKCEIEVNGEANIFISKMTNIAQKLSRKLENLNITCSIEETDKECDLAFAKSNLIQQTKESFVKEENNYEFKTPARPTNKNPIEFSYSYFKNISKQIKQRLKEYSNVKLQINRKSLRNSKIKGNESDKRSLNNSLFELNVLENDSMSLGKNHNNSFYNDQKTTVKSFINFNSILLNDEMIIYKKRTKMLLKEENKNSNFFKSESLQSTNITNKTEKDQALIKKQTIEEFENNRNDFEENIEKESESKIKESDDSLTELEFQPKIISKKISFNLHRKSKSIVLSKSNSLNDSFCKSFNIQNESSIKESKSAFNNDGRNNKRKLSRKISLNSDNENLNIQEFKIEKLDERINESNLNLNQLINYFDLFLAVHKKIMQKLRCHIECHQMILQFFKILVIDEFLFSVEDKNERNFLNDFFVVLELFLILAYDFSQEGLIYDIHISYLIDIAKRLLKVLINFLNLIILKRENLYNAVSIESFQNFLKEKLGKYVDFEFKEEAELIINLIRTSNFEINEAIKKIIPKHPNDFIRNLLNKYLSNQITINTLYLNEYYIKNFCFEFQYENKDYSDLINSNKENKSLEILKEKITCFRIRLNVNNSLRNCIKNNLNSANESRSLMKKAGEKPFALVLDLDETLIHFEFTNKNQANNNDYYHSDGVLHIRPGLYEFLEFLKEHYELIIFTLGTQGYADPILDTIENGKSFFSQRLYRANASIYEMDFAKDLSNLGRDLSKIAIVDNLERNFVLQKENGILIKSFHGNDPQDRSLFELKEILMNIALSDEEDFRVAIKNKSDIIKEVVSY